MASTVRRVAVTGRATPDVAWERYAEIAAWPTWAPQLHSVEADGPRLAAGRSGTVRVVGGFGVPFVVTDVDEAARTWSWLARLGPLTMTLHHTLWPDPRGTRAGLVLEGPVPLVSAYAPLTRVPLARLVRP